MKGLILAAGRGRRMEELGDEGPKCLVRLDGRPLIERQVAALRGGGVNEVGVVTGYKSEMLHFEGISHFHNPHWATTNMVKSLMEASSWLRAEPVIVSYADIFYRDSLIRDLVGAPGALVIAYDKAWKDLWSKRFADPLADAETFRVDSHGTLLEIGGKTQNIADIEGQYMGLLKFTPEAWNSMEELIGSLDEPTRCKLDMTSLLRRVLAARSVRISTVATTGQWGEIDNPGDVTLYQKLVASGELQLQSALTLSPQSTGTNG